MQARTRLLCTSYCDTALMWHIPPPNSDSSFKVSVILWDRNFDDSRRNARYLWCYL